MGQQDIQIKKMDRLVNTCFFSTNT